MAYLIAALTGYLMGCSNLAYFLAKARGFDIRTKGSNNAGASNATITMGLKIGVLVAVHDVLKATLAALVISLLFPSTPNAGLVAGGCAVMGHIFPFYLKKGGGKGFASFMGLILALDWKFFLAIALLALIITVVTDYIVCATMTTVATFPVHLFFFLQNNWLPAILVAAVSLVIIYKHIPNFGKLARGEEIGLRTALSGKSRAS